MSLAIGDTAPDFEAQTTEGLVRFHAWIGQVLNFHLQPHFSRRLLHQLRKLQH